MHLCARANDRLCGSRYGGALTDLQWRQGIIDSHSQQKELLDAPSMALPIVSLHDPSTSTGVSFVQSANDHPVSMTLSTAPASPRGATFQFSRQYHRLGGGAAAVAFSQSVILHEDYFRPVLRWCVEQSERQSPDVYFVCPCVLIRLTQV